jgi:hypothetical protein
MKEAKMLPTVARIVYTDYLALILCVIPAVALAGAGALVVTGRIDITAVISSLATDPIGGFGHDGMVLGAALLLTILCPLLLAIRLRKIRRIFREGREAAGRVVFFRQFRDRGRIEFEFEHEGGVVRAANPVHLSHAVRLINVGQNVTVVYLPHNPKTALIKEIFQ